ncbi:MAG: cyanophycin synthetase [Chlorobiaceae bacterium]|nr:cyanophycin synthetase [Chlorobiaceae bacterium]
MFFQGTHAGLAGKTVRFTLKFGDFFDEWPFSEETVLEHVLKLRPGDPMIGVRPHELPGSVLVGSESATPFSRWLAAMIVVFLRLAGEPVFKARVVSSSGNAIVFAVEWGRQTVFNNAIQLALRHLLSWIKPGLFPENPARLAKNMDDWLSAVTPGGLPFNTTCFVEAALRRNIPVSYSLFTGTVKLGWGKNSVRMERSFTDGTSVIAARIARQKFNTTPLLQLNKIPVPSGSLAINREQAIGCAMKLGWPVVIKHSTCDQGVGVVTRITGKDSLLRAFDKALQLSPQGVIIEKHIEGEDFRLLVVGGRMLAAAKRTPGGVTGDGKSTVRELLQTLNADPQRGSKKDSLLISIDFDDEAAKCLREQGLTIDSVPENGNFVRLRGTANISTGGTAFDVTGMVHPDNRMVAERAARLVGLDIAGIDFISPDITKSWHEAGGSILEVNAQPGLRVHWISSCGRDVHGEVIDWLFREKSSRIPIAAITGTNGKSTTAMMLNHIWKETGMVSGVCTTGGVWIGEELVSTMNLSGFPGGKIILEDPAVEAAVIEMPRKGLIYMGHPCDRYDVAAMLNVQDDHIGVDGINSLEEMASLKAEVIERATKAVVVNAEDSLCLGVLGRCSAPMQIFVSRDPSLPVLLEHLDRGGFGVFTADCNGTDWIVFAEGKNETPVMPIDEIPATLNGILRYNQSNAMFAAALAWAHGIGFDDIRRGLSSFSISMENNPGRYNFVEGFEFRVLLDYAHNPDGVRELCGVVSELSVKGKRRIYNQYLGNRHKAHIDAAAPFLATAFDSFLLGCDRGRVLKNPEWAGNDPEGEMIGYTRSRLLSEGVQPDAILTEKDPEKAIHLILQSAEPGDLVVLLAEPRLAIPLLKKRLAADR